MIGRSLQTSCRNLASKDTRLFKRLLVSLVDELAIVTGLDGRGSVFKAVDNRDRTAATLNRHCGNCKIVSTDRKVFRSHHSPLVLRVTRARENFRSATTASRRTRSSTAKMRLKRYPTVAPSTRRRASSRRNPITSSCAIVTPAGSMRIGASRNRTSPSRADDRHAHEHARAKCIALPFGCPYLDVVPAVCESIEHSPVQP